MARQAPGQIDRRRDQVCRQLDDLVEHGRLRGREVYFFGATLDFHWYVEHLQGRGVSVEAVIDNAPYKHGRSYAGILVLGPDALREAHDPVILITSPPYAYEMAEQLSAMGYVAGRDHFIVTGTRTTRLSRLRDLASDVRQIVRGYRVVKRIQRRHGKDAHLLLCPYPGTGDAYLQGMYLPAYIEANQLANPVIVTNGRLVSKVLALFDLEAQEVIDQDETDALNAALQFFGDRLVPVTALQFRGMRTRPGPNAYIAEDVPNFRQVFERDVFGLEDPEIRAPRFEDDPATVAAFFERAGLEPGRTAVIAPYMGSHWNIQIPMAFWERLAAELHAAGWQVCTNSSGESEPPIAGTLPVFFPLAQAVPILDAAGLFIAIRSGLCDVVSSTTAKQVVLYLGGSHVIMRHYYSLRAMGLSPEAHELEYDDNDDEVLSEIHTITGRVDG